MRTPKLITNYSGMSDADLSSLATRTVDALRTNTNFPDMNPAFDDYELIALDYVAKQAITATGRASGVQKEEKDEARKALLKSMRAVASYINNATSVSSQQLSSGFVPVADPKGLQAPDAPAWARIGLSKRQGEILLEFGAVREAYQYEMQIASEVDENGEFKWESLPLVSNSRGNFFTPVEDGVQYYLRVRSHNKRGTSGWSPIATRKVWVV